VELTLGLLESETRHLHIFVEGKALKHILFVLCLILAVAGLAMAQDAPKAEVFGGYSFVRADVGVTDSQTMHGWNGSLTGNVNKYFGITADISGAYKSVGITGASLSVKDHLFMFGPTLSYRTERAKPFAHVLFGLSRASAGVNVNALGQLIQQNAGDTSYAIAFGGGLDVKATKAIDIRLGQFDFVRTNHFSAGQNNIRFAAGVVFNLGSK
jgi:hypothetical protein